MKRSIHTTLLVTLLAIFVFSSASSALQPKRYRPGVRYQQPKRFQQYRQYKQRQQQKRFASIGLQFGHEFDFEDFTIGGQLDLPVGQFWSFVPSFDYMLTDDDTPYDRWQLNTDLHFHPSPRGIVYLGGGLAVENMAPEHGDNEMDFGGSALIGLEFGGQNMPMRAFVQTRWTFLDETYFSVQGGVKLALR